MILHGWQSECLNMWARNGFRGIVNAVTGSGKTVLALSAVRRLEKKSDRDLRIKIVVPQTFLASQWMDEIKRLLGANASDIGVYSGNRKDVGRKYTIYVVNSARYSLARHILSDVNEGNAVFLIADECHHYGSAENSRIFDFHKRLQDSDSRYYALGLSATPEIVNFKAISVPLGPEIYCYDLSRALKDQIISRFILFSVRLGFTPEEGEEYDNLSDGLKKCLAVLYSRHRDLKGMTSSGFFARLQILAQADDDDARAALFFMYKRRALCHTAEERPLCAIMIVKAISADSKVILFCERIQTAELLHRRLADELPGQAGLYHSKMADNERRDMLERFRHGGHRLLVCCKALDEGLNIPSADAGIIVSSTSSARQRVQRLGRILRRSKEIKRIYYLYIGESNEESELVLGLRAMENSIPLITLRFHGGEFIHSEYEKLRNNVLEYVLERRNDAKLLGALDKNLDRALLCGDFLLSEKACRDNLHASRSVAERNYWASVLYAIYARQNKLN